MMWLVIAIIVLLAGNVFQYVRIRQYYNTLGRTLAALDTVERWYNDLKPLYIETQRRWMTGIKPTNAEAFEWKNDQAMLAYNEQMFAQSQNANAGSDYSGFAQILQSPHKYGERDDQT